MNAITGKEFEELLVYRAVIEAEKGTYVQARCGTMAVFIDKIWTPVRSLPDFSLCLKEFGGQTGVFDCKVVSGSSYPLSGGTHKSFKHQYKYMREHQRFGAIAFVLMHFNPRVMKTKTEDAFTVLIPIEDKEPWASFDTSERHAISRHDAILYGLPVEWDLAGSTTRTTLSPNLYKTILAYNASKGRLPTVTS